MPGVIPSQGMDVSYRGEVNRNRQLVESKAQSQEDGVPDEQNKNDSCVVGRSQKEDCRKVVSVGGGICFDRSLSRTHKQEG
jgi:hypothetical protein